MLEGWARANTKTAGRYWMQLCFGLGCMAVLHFRGICALTVPMAD